MMHKDIPFGAVVNFNQSERGPLEVQFIVRQEGIHLLYDPVTKTGYPLLDFGMSIAGQPNASSGESVVSGTQSESDECV
jgi:hypothetical protein